MSDKLLLIGASKMCLILQTVKNEGKRKMGVDNRTMETAQTIFTGDDLLHMMDERMSDFGPQRRVTCESVCGFSGLGWCRLGLQPLHFTLFFVA